MGLGKIGAKGCMKASKASGPGPMSPMITLEVSYYWMRKKEKVTT